MSLGSKAGSPHGKRRAFRIYSGVHVPSKAFAEVVEHETGTPWISVEDLQALIGREANIAIYDGRSCEGRSLKDVESILDAHYLGRDIQLAEAAVLKLEARTKL
jgi:hypothetical protein